ncbi:MAG: UDP-N-acetylmuramoyl-L-alanyl-D-glutamate--2,6-diaminopimelate ligase [Alphaproteobacteria bacterium]
MLLSDLIKNIRQYTDIGVQNEGADLVVTVVTNDSRQVIAGSLFIAKAGSRVDGINFVQEAIKAGAVAVMLPSNRLPVLEQILPDIRVPLLLVGDIEKALLLTAQFFYPRQPATLVGVTGTNGKTSTVQFCRQFWHLLGVNAACLGTLGLTLGKAQQLPASAPAIAPLTTMDSLSLHAILDYLACNQVNNLALEASSHGLHQGRLDGVQLDVAVFTNLSRDHLDYHANMQEYWQAKKLLFTTRLKKNGVMVVNADTPQAAELGLLAKEQGHRFIDYGVAAKAIQLQEIVADEQGQWLSFTIEGKNHRVYMPVVGRFQASNVMAAMGVMWACGYDVEAILAQIHQLQGVEGRMELAGKLANGAVVYVDYAHTPDALETVLQALRPHVGNHLHVVFGCGGDRDPGKRPLMGEIAQKLADRVIITDDNPRSENPAYIRAQIMASCPSALEIGDRAEAIHVAVSRLQKGDILLLAGKGHEQGQIINGHTRPFDDREQAVKAIMGCENRNASINLGTI